MTAPAVCRVHICRRHGTHRGLCAQHYNRAEDLGILESWAEPPRAVPCAPPQPEPVAEVIALNGDPVCPICRERAVKCRGLCGRCYNRALRTGELDRIQRGRVEAPLVWTDEDDDPEPDALERAAIDGRIALERERKMGRPVPPILSPDCHGTVFSACPPPEGK